MSKAEGLLALAASFLRILVIWIFIMTSHVDIVITTEQCDVAQNQCVRQTGCGRALQNYVIHCAKLISGQTAGCSSGCKKALISLLSTDDNNGQMFMTCDCQGANFCLEQKARLEVCTQDVLTAMRSVYDEGTLISCSLAELICSADTSCLTALEYYQRHCTRLFKGQKCTRRCNNSLSILYRQRKARKLRTCLCDGTELYDCPTLQANTQRLCFKNDMASTTPRVRHPTKHHHARANAGKTSKENFNNITNDCLDKVVRTGTAAVTLGLYHTTLLSLLFTTLLTSYVPL